MKHKHDKPIPNSNLCTTGPTGSYTLDSRSTQQEATPTSRDTPFPFVTLAAQSSSSISVRTKLLGCNSQLGSGVLVIGLVSCVVSQPVMALRS